MEQISYTIKEACNALGIGTTKLYEEINSGRLKAFKFGKRTLIPKSALEDWFKNLDDYIPQNIGGQ